MMQQHRIETLRRRGRRGLLGNRNGRSLADRQAASDSRRDRRRLLALFAQREVKIGVVEHEADEVERKHRLQELALQIPSNGVFATPDDEDYDGFDENCDDGNDYMDNNCNSDTDGDGELDLPSRWEDMAAAVASNHRKPSQKRGNPFWHGQKSRPSELTLAITHGDVETYLAETYLS